MDSVAVDRYPSWWPWAPFELHGFLAVAYGAIEPQRGVADHGAMPLGEAS